MSEPVAFQLGDILILKKPHPCGGHQWEVVRLGMDIGIRCLGCSRRVLLSRRELERRLRSRAGAPSRPSPSASPTPGSENP